MDASSIWFGYCWAVVAPGGATGIVWLVLFIVGAFVIQGDSPDSTQTIGEIKSYWASDSGKYLVSDWTLTTSIALIMRKEPPPSTERVMAR